MRIAVYPGSFDPITKGHLDIIKRASKMFDKVIVAVVLNPSKHPMFSFEERRDFIVKSVESVPGLDNIEVVHYDGLLADYAAERNANAIIKGLRAMSDFEYECQMALTNKKLNPNVETLFLTTATQNMYLSSSMVKQVASMGGDISSFVPEVIKQDIIDRIYIKK